MKMMTTTMSNSRGIAVHLRLVEPEPSEPDYSPESGSAALAVILAMAMATGVFAGILIGWMIWA
jgi:F0F1-type ATP synthase assembly protein I